MRISLNENLVASQLESQAELERLCVELGQQLATLNVHSLDLQQKLSLEVSSDTAADLSHEIEIINALIDSLKAYSVEMKCKKTLGMNRNKMSQADISVLEAQVVGMKKVCAILKGSDAQCPLSESIDSVGKMEYQLSYARIWARRVANILGSAVAVAAAVAVVCALMSPGVHIPAAIAMIPSMLASAAAFVYLRQPATVSTPLAIGPFHTTVATNIPTTIGVFSAGVIGASLFQKLHITDPTREEAARKVPMAAMDYLVIRLRKKVALLKESELTQFLNKVIDEAHHMYKSGSGSWFYESRSSKMQKATLILREVAKFTERDDINKYTVGAALASKVGDSDYSFQQLLNAQRNPSLFTSRSSRLFKAVCRHVSVEKSQPAIRLKSFATQ